MDGKQGILVGKYARPIGAYGTADDPNDDVAADGYSTYGPNHGYRTDFGSQSHRTVKICLRGYDVSESKMRKIRCQRRDLDGRPVGTIEDVVSGLNANGQTTVTVSGWVLDPDASVHSKFQINHDGVLSAEYFANSHSATVEAHSRWSAWGPNHGFSRVFVIPDGQSQRQHRFCLRGINKPETGGSAVGLGCKFIVPGLIEV